MRTHPTDLLSFVPGVVSVTVAIVALAGGLTLDALATDWVWPAVLIGLGLLVLATAGIGRRTPATAQGPEDARDEVVDEPLDDREHEA